jgi:hypothetical protein
MSKTISIFKDTLMKLGPTLPCISFISPVEAVRVLTSELAILPDILIIVPISTSMDKKNRERLERAAPNFCFQKPTSFLEYEETLQPVLLGIPVSIN